MRIDIRSLLMGLVIFGAIGFLYSQVLELRSEVSHLNSKIERIEGEQGKTMQLGISSAQPGETLVARVEAPKLSPTPVASTKTGPTSDWNAQLLAMLHQMNINHGTKRVFYHTGSVTIADSTVTREDSFFQLLGFLKAQNRFKGIELPRKMFDGPLHKGLLGFGIPATAIKATPIENIRILIKEN